MTLAFALLVALADDFDAKRPDHWHQWRGPDGDGLAPKGDPPVEWSGTKNVKWKVAIPGSGSATPIVWEGKIFVLSAVDPSGKTPEAPAGGRGMSRAAPTTPLRFEVLCLDRQTGKELWRKTAIEQTPHEGTHPSHGYASASPSTDGERLIVPFGSRGIFSFGLDGTPGWKVDLGDMKIKVGFGEGASPTLHRGNVIVNWDHEAGSFIACLDAATGKEKWRTARDEGTTWVTPFVVEQGGVTQVVVNGSKQTRAYTLADGKLLWEIGGQASNPIATAVTREGLVYCMTGHRGFAVTAIKLGSKGEAAWSRTDAGAYVASPLLLENILYSVKGNSGILTAMDAATGKDVFGPARLEGIDQIYASLVGAAGRVYVTGRNGRTIVLKHGPKYEVLASNSLPEGVDASPAIVGKELFLRGARHLWCLSGD